MAVISDPCCRHPDGHSPSPGHSPDLPAVLRQYRSLLQHSGPAVAALLGLDLTGLDVLVGLSCSPITVIGNNCGGTSVTCDAPENEWGGLIAINCIPITL
ncbi:hydrophobin [Mycena olivaceomarginata]|nr:hydrophobin [Mycena olivaceomarginata]